MAQQWFLIRDGKEHGPISGTQLREMAATGKLGHSDLVRRDDMPSPVKAKSLKGLFSIPEAIVLGPAKHGLPVPAVPSATIPEAVPSSEPTENTVPKAFFETPAIVAVLILVCFPVGLYVLWTRQSWPKNRKVLWTGVVGSAVMLIGCVLPAIVAVAEKVTGKKLVERNDKRAERNVAPTVSRKDVLSADFYPFKSGTVQKRAMTLSLGDDGESRSQREYSFKGADLIDIRSLSHFTLPGLKTLPLPKPRTLKYRTTAEFVEIGEDREAVKKTTWRPVIKIGAKVGDRWKSQPMESITEDFRVTDMSDLDLTDQKIAPKIKVWAATIERTTTADAGRSSPVIVIEETVYGLGVGPLLTRSWRLEGGQRRLNWSEVLLAPSEK